MVGIAVRTKDMSVGNFLSGLVLDRYSDKFSVPLYALGTVVITLKLFTMSKLFFSRIDIQSHPHYHFQIYS